MRTCDACGGRVTSRWQRVCGPCWRELHSPRLSPLPLFAALARAGLTWAEAGRLYDLRYGTRSRTGERYLWRAHELGRISVAEADRWACVLGCTIHDLWEEARWTA
jgi:hypothetical protein